MTYTFVIRSKDRIVGAPNDFRVQLPYLPDLARNEYWCVSVQRCVFPKSNGYTVWVDSTQGLHEPVTNKLLTHDFAEIRLDFGGAAKGHDTDINGGRVVHFVTGRTANVTALFESGPTDSVEYEIARPNLAELHVQVVNAFGAPLGAMLAADFPTFSASATLTNDETALPDWFMILKVYAKNM